MVKIGMLLSDRYEIIEKIGSGGMSDVYKAKCNKLNRQVAIKVLKQEYSSDKNFVSKFWAEAQSAACLAHPNIVNVYDVGTDQGVYYIVMELIEGITLKKYIEKKEKLEIRESIGIAMQVCQGIEAAHDQKIIHRDIKPQNIIISRDGKVKVTDFGIARAASSQTISSNAMGSVHYISPEQARGGYCDERSDIYSMGIVMYEMLTGKVPFEGESTVQVALMHIQSEMVPPTEHEPMIPVSLEKIILKCTQKKPESRYASIAALIADLRRALMTPDEDFVKIVPVVNSNDPTRVMSSEEVEQIKNETRAAGPVVDADEEAYLMGYEEEEEKDLEDQYEEYEDEDEDDEEEDKKEKVITIISIVVAVLIVILAVFILFKALNLFGNEDTPETTTQEQITTTESDSKTSVMPNLVGKTLSEAEDMLEELQLGISVEYVTAPGEEDGIVLSQEFDEGDTVNKHYRVTVVVCDNSGIADIPEGLVGSSYEAARKALRDAGFEPHKTEEYNEDVEEGMVISLDPVEGTTGLEKGTVVEVVVSAGPRPVIVPDVKGQDVEAATTKIKNAGLKVVVDEQYHDTVAAGKVISTSPAGGKEVKADSSVTIVVSKGTDKVTVPDLTGKTPTEASDALTEIGLVLNSTYEEDFSDEIEIGKIMGQSVEAGYKAVLGSSVTITVSKGPNEVVVPDLSTCTTQQAAIEILEALGLKCAFATQDSVMPKDQICGQKEAKGTKVPAGSTITVYISTGVAPTIAIPSLSGTEADVTTALTALGFKVATTKEYSDTVAAGNVIRYSPAPGTEAKAGDTITLVVSLGPKPVETVVIPADLSGTKAEIEARLTALGLVAVVTEANSDTVAAGTVISSNPALGSTVEKGSTVTVTVSIGPAEPESTEESGEGNEETEDGGSEGGEGSGGGEGGEGGTGTGN